MKYLSLFSGIGGFEVGLLNSKYDFECVGYSEIDKYARSIYEKQFIKKLSRYNQDADITLTISEDITLSYICEDTKGNRLSKKTTMQVFIEPADNCPECVHEYMNGDDKWCSFYDKECRKVDECFQFEEFDER